MEVKVFDGDLTKAMKIFKRKLQQEGLFREMKNRRYYEKPSIKKRRKSAEAEKRLRKKLKKKVNF